MSKPPSFNVRAVAKRRSLHPGQNEPAVCASNQMQAAARSEYLHAEHVFLMNYVATFCGMKTHVLIRFGKWEAMLDETAREGPLLFCVINATWQYANGIAHAVSRNIEEALE